MAAIGNIIWFLLMGGLFGALAWLFFGVVLCATIIGVPAGIAAFRLAGFVAFPFGKELVDARMLGEKRIPGTALANLLWILLAGLWLAISHCMAGLACFVSCILILPILFGAPAWGMAHFNIAAAALAPLGKRAVPKAIATEARRRHANAILDQKLG